MLGEQRSSGDPMFVKVEYRSIGPIEIRPVSIAGNRHKGANGGDDGGSTHNANDDRGDRHDWDASAPSYRTTHKPEPDRRRAESG